MMGAGPRLPSVSPLLVDTATGVVSSARQHPSPNYNQRPAGMSIDLVVIHNITLPPGCYGGAWIDDLFCNRLTPHHHPYFQTLMGLEVSAHLLIRRDGELVQYVPCQYRAWHAGRSHYRGRDNCNDFSIGIELEGCDHDPYEGVQYQQLVALLRGLFNAYPTLSADRLTGHSDIAPGRKSDPGPAFNWRLLRRWLAEP